MTHRLVADVGNSRIKWGWCEGNALRASAALTADDPAAWQHQLAEWRLDGTLKWLIAGVHPPRRDALADWLRRRGDTVTVLDDWRQVPVRTRVEQPGRVGIDRLLQAVAANSRTGHAVPAALVGAGTAITVDWVDQTGAFCGGAILPGLHLMTRCLHEHTALLPLVELPEAAPTPPGATTEAAVQVGIFWAAAGGIEMLVRQMAQRAGAARYEVFLTGGDGPLLAPVLDPSYHLWPQMTLEGLRISAESLW